MKRSNYLTRVITLLLFGFLLIYFSGMIIQALQNPLRTAPATFLEVEEGFITSGIIIREEYVLGVQYPILSSLVHDGERVSVGMAYLSAYATQADRERSARSRMLAEEIAQIQAQQGFYGGSEQRAMLEADIRRNLRELAQSTRAGDFSQVESQTIQVRTLSLAGNEGELQQRLTQLQNEQAAIQALGINVNQVTAHRAGVYHSRTDGFEYLDVDAVMALNRGELETLLARDTLQNNRDGAGKLVTSSTWYYVALIPQAEYEAFYLRYTRQILNRVLLRFEHVEDVPMRVYYLGEIEDGFAKVILASTTALADTLHLRHVEAQVTYRRVSGIAVPTDAVHFDEIDPETGRVTAYVFRLVANMAERAFVHIIYEGEDFYLVAPDMGRSTPAGALREGNTIIVRAGQLYHGRIVRR